MSKRRCGSGGTRSTQRRSVSGGRGGQRRHHLALLDAAGRPGGSAASCDGGVRALGEPGVELELEVELVRERPAGLEAALDEVLQPLDDALGLRIGRRAEVPVDPQLAAERGELLASGGRRGRGCRPGDPRPASAAAPPATTDSARSRPAGPASAWRRSARRRRRASSPGTRRRPSRAASGRARPGPRPCGSQRSNWQTSPGPIDRPLKRPRRRREQRPHLAQIVIDDRLAAIEAQRRDQLADALARAASDPRSSSRWISSLNGSSFDPAGARE